MTAFCPQVIHLCYVRATRLSSVGEPVAGPNNVVVDDDPMMLTLTPDILAGETKDLKNGCDNLTATYRGQDIPKRMNLELDVLKLSPAFEELMTGGEVVSNSNDDPIGVNLRVGCGTQSPFVAFEAWQDLWDCDHQPSDPYRYRRWIFPSSRWVRGAETAQNDFGQPKFSGFSVGNTNWGLGIFDDLSEPVGQAGQWVFDNVLPTAACGYQSHAIT